MFQNMTPVTKKIILANVAVYILTNFINFPVLYAYFSAFLPFSPYFHWWQIGSHMFMHETFRDNPQGIMHILFNMFTLASFGPIMEQVLGQKKFTIMYFVSGLAAYALTVLSYYISINFGENPQNFYGVSMLGASGCISGVMACFAVLFPDAPITIMFIPIPIKAKYLLGVFIIVSILLGFAGNVGGVAHFAHVGGAVAGLVFAWIWKKNRFLQR